MMKKLYSVLAAILLAASLGALAAPASAQSKKGSKAEASARVRTPLNLAVLVQDDLVSRVGNELKVTSEFIRSLPAGSRVLVGYIRTGSLQVRQPFTTDLSAAAHALRIPVGSSAVARASPARASNAAVPPSRVRGSPRRTDAPQRAHARGRCQPAFLGRRER